jgi:hypothetical protein
MCKSEDGEFALFTTKAYHTAKLKFGDVCIDYHLHDLQNMLRILHLADDQQKTFLQGYRKLWIMLI